MPTIINGSSPSITFSDSTTQSTAALPLTGGTVTGGVNLATSSGNVGIGTASPAVRLDVLRSGDGTAVKWGNGTTSGSLFTSATQVALLDGGTLSNGLGIVPATNYVYLATAGTERMRIDSSGNLLVGTTGGIAGSNAYKLVVLESSGGGLGCKVSTNGAYGVGFVNASDTTVGYVQVNVSSTVYSTSSDYRLKENIAPMQNALNVVQQLKPVTYNWKVDGSSGQGFIAHELQAVVPDCVTGEKDAVDTEGNPKYQGIDTSFLVATLTAAIQELKAELDTTKAEIEALKAK